MNTQDNLYIGKDARDKLIAGITKLAQAIGATMGTKGSNAILQSELNPGHLVTNDGLTIAQAIVFADPIEDMGRKILLEAITAANKQSGDGSSTTTVLTAKILTEGIKHLNSGDISPMELKRQLEDCLPAITASIAAQTKTITLAEVGQVAAISAEDKAIGALIQEIYNKIGEEGIIYWDISKTAEDSYSIGTGLTVNGAGFTSAYMCDMDAATQRFTNNIKWQNPKVLICKDKISSAMDLDGIFKMLFEQGSKELIIFCSDIEAPVVADLVLTRAKTGFKSMVVRMPVLWRDEWYTDLALASGATIVDRVAGLTFKNVTNSHIGSFGNVVVDKDDTFIDGIADLTAHVAALKEGDENDKIRAARLNTKTARLYLGAISSSALSYKRLKAEDAINAAWQALHGGVVPGGGSALVNASTYLTTDIQACTVGEQILKEALMEPARQIATNAGKPDMIIGHDYFNGFGFDTVTNTFVDMFAAGIIDPAPVVLNAVRNAVSVAASILSANALVLLPEKDESISSLRQMPRM